MSYIEIIQSNSSFALVMEALTITKWMLSLVVILTTANGCEQQPELGESAVKQDEEAIRKWFDDWIAASKDGDLELAKSLIADDAIFLVPGVGQMDKQSFAEAATASDPNTNFELDCGIQEIQIFGDRAWLLSTLSLVMTDKETSKRTLMKGDGISILERRGDGWVVIRDANTMIVVPDE